MSGTKQESKFAANTFYKLRGDCCDFVLVKKVYRDNGEHAELDVDWFTQLARGYRRLCSDRFEVRKSKYHKWNVYRPNGGETK